MKHIFLILIAFSFHSCHYLSYRQEPDKDFNQIISNLPDSNNALKYNGLYSLINIDSSSYICDSLYENGGSFIDPIIFYGNGIVDYDGEMYVVNIEQYIQYTERIKKYSQNPFGVFKVSDKNIDASIYMVFLGNGDSFNFWYLCHFTGVIDGNRILNWKMVPPLPKFHKLERERGYNIKKIAYLMQPKDFEFKPFPQKTLLDSNGVWLNKYRKK